MRGREKMLEKLLSTLPAYCERIVVDDDDKLLAAKRNKGAAIAKGEYILFIDDDNYCNRWAVGKLTSCFKKEYGIMGMTATYDDNKKVIADGGSLRNMITGFMKGLRTNEEISPKDDLYEVDEVANAFMIRRDVFEKVGGFDEKNFPIDLDEADICRRIKSLGYKIMMHPGAICHHKSQTYSRIPDFRRPMNAYFMLRNKVFFQRKHLHPIKYALYLVCFYPINLVGYIASMIYRNNYKMIKYILLGSYHGVINKKLPELWREFPCN